MRNKGASTQNIMRSFRTQAETTEALRKYTNALRACETASNKHEANQAVIDTLALLEQEIKLMAGKTEKPTKKLKPWNVIGANPLKVLMQKIQDCRNNRDDKEMEQDMDETYKWIHQKIGRAHV